MRIFSRVLSFLLTALLFAACAPKSTPTTVFHGENPYAPQAGDSNLRVDDVTIDSSSVELTKSQPPQVMVNFAYFQPTPCHQLRVEVSGPDKQNQISLKAYAVTEKDVPCNQLIVATPLQASLNLGSFPKGHYTVVLNGNQIGEFDL